MWGVSRVSRASLGGEEGRGVYGALVGGMGEADAELHVS